MVDAESSITVTLDAVPPMYSPWPLFVDSVEDRSVIVDDESPANEMGYSPAVPPLETEFCRTRVMPLKADVE